ncbi:MAG: DUF6677 family protein [Sedimentisphaerales bacterium]
MVKHSSQNHLVFLITVGLLAWVVPGAGHYMLKEKKRAIIIFLTIVLTFLIGLYVGSIGVINPVDAKTWYLAQIMNSPMVAALGHLTATAPEKYRVFGRPNEIGQIYTGIAGLLNLLCIVNAVYLAHLQGTNRELTVKTPGKGSRKAGSQTGGKYKAGG